MKRILSIFLVFAFIIGLCGCNGGKVSDSLLVSESNGVNEEEMFSEMNAIQGNLGIYAGNLNGFRAVGYLNDKEESDYLAEYMRTIGLKNVEQVPIEFDGWNVSDLKMIFECECQSGGTYTIHGFGVHPTEFNLSNEETSAVYVKSLLSNNPYDPNDLVNKGVLISSSENIGEEVDKAIELGASFVVYPCEKNMGFRVDVSKGVSSEIPVFVVDNLHYSLMVDKVSIGDEVKMTLSGNSVINEGITSDFIVGEIVGKNKNKYVYVTANRDSINSGHYGSRYGVSELLYLAKSLVDEGYKPKYTIRFLITTGQEYGYIDNNVLNVGIRKYLETIDLDSVKYCVNMELGSPLVDTALTEVQFSDSIMDSRLYKDIEKHNADVKEFNDSFITMLNPISKSYNTDGLVWDELGVPTIIQGEPIVSTYYKLEGSSLDSSKSDVDKESAVYLFWYIRDILKLICS